MTPEVRHVPHARRSLLRRMTLVFAAAVVITALALALSAYLITKSDQDSRALSEALDQSRQNLTVADSMLPAEPVPSDYERLMRAFQIRGDFATLMEVASEPEPYRSGPDVTREPVTSELVEAMADGRIHYQVVDVGGEPTIVVGSRLRSGELTTFFFYPQGQRLADLAGLRNVLLIAGVILAALGAIAGYLLARALVRPIREASKAAAQMAQGDLDIRLPAGSDEFGVLASSFNRMAENLQAKMLDLEAGQVRERRFVADVTHELRTPLSALVGEASLLKSKLESDPASCSSEISRLVTMVNGDITRLRVLVDDLLEISRLDAQAVDTVIEAVDVGSFLTQLAGVHGWSEGVQIVLESGAGGLDQSGDRPLVARVDRRRLERIIVNLVQNAIQHGATPVTIRARRGVAAAPTDEGIIQIAVADSGDGIAPEHLPHIFDRFYKADPSRASGRGSGLGLAIARENARLLGGDLTAANVPDGGAFFLLVLPETEIQDTD